MCFFCLAWSKSHKLLVENSFLSLLENEEPGLQQKKTVVVAVAAALRCLAVAVLVVAATARVANVLVDLLDRNLYS